jgi:hypothetical protein
MMSPALLASRELAVVALDSYEMAVEVIWKGGARRGRAAGCGGCGEPLDCIWAAIIRVG